MMRFIAISMAFTAAVALAAEPGDPVSIEGEYTLVSGKKLGKNPDEEAKKSKITIDKKHITIEGKGVRFVIKYTLNPKAAPNAVDLEIVEGPDGTKGEIALGIVERTKDQLKLAYSLELNKRPTDFEGTDGMLFVFKPK